MLTAPFPATQSAFYQAYRSLELNQAVAAHNQVIERVIRLQRLALGKSDLETLDKLATSLEEDYQKFGRWTRWRAERQDDKFTTYVDQISFEVPPKTPHIVFHFRHPIPDDLVRIAPSPKSALRLRYECLAVERLKQDLWKKIQAREQEEDALTPLQDKNLFVQTAASDSSFALIQKIVDEVIPLVSMIRCPEDTDPSQKSSSPSRATIETLAKRYTFDFNSGYGRLNGCHWFMLSNRQIASRPVRTTPREPDSISTKSWPASPSTPYSYASAPPRLDTRASHSNPSELDVIDEGSFQASPNTCYSYASAPPRLTIAPLASFLPPAGSQEETYCLIFEKKKEVRGGFRQTAWYYWSSQQADEEYPMPSLILDEQGTCRLDELRAILKAP